MNALQLVTEPKMTLKEITDLLSVEHNKAMKTVEIMATSPEFGTVAKTSTAYNKHGQTVETYALDKRQSIAVSAKLNTALLMRVIDRWQELEAKQIEPYKLPANYLEALKELVVVYEEKELALKQIESDKPKVEFAMAVRNMQGACPVSSFSKTLGIGRNKFFKMMREDGFLMKNNLPYQRYLDNVCFLVNESIPYTGSEGKTHPAFTTMITGKGQVMLEKRYHSALH